jgi:hypothetical protein
MRILETSKIFMCEKIQVDRLNEPTKFNLDFLPPDYLMTVPDVSLSPHHGHLITTADCNFTVPLKRRPKPTRIWQEEEDEEEEDDDVDRRERCTTTQLKEEACMHAGELGRCFSAVMSWHERHHSCSHLQDFGWRMESLDRLG